MSQVWEHAPCRENALIVLLALADWANDDGVSWPSIQKLADKTRIDRRSAQRIIRRLKSDGIITIEEGGGRAKQHRYRIETAALCRPLENSDIVNSDFPDIETAALRTERATFPTQTATRVSPDPLEEPLEEPSLEPPYGGRDFQRALKAFKKHRTEIKKPLSTEAERLLYSKLSGWGERNATQALEDAVINRWQGVFEPRHNGRQKPIASFGYPNVTDLPPLPEGVKNWSCVCGFSVIRGDVGTNTCPDCGCALIEQVRIGGLLSEYERQAGL